MTDPITTASRFHLQVDDERRARLGERIVWTLTLASIVIIIALVLGATLHLY